MTAPRTPGKRLLGPGYAQVLRVFANGPAMWTDVAAACGTKRASSQGLCNGLHRQRIIHITEWRAVKGTRRLQWTPVYLLGDGIDAKPPVPLRTSKAPTPFELLGFCEVIRALQADSWHSKGLADHLGQCARTVRGIVRELHKLRLVYIDDYTQRPKAGAGFPLFTWGPGEQDAKKPAPKSARKVWMAANAVVSERRKQMHLMHAIVRGVSLDGRRNKAANRETAEAAA
jgi:hypothetical protein